jgi:hypothetical protein
MSDSEQGDGKYPGPGEYDAKHLSKRVEYVKPDPNEHPVTGIVHIVTVLGKRTSRPPTLYTDLDSGIVQEDAEDGWEDSSSEDEGDEDEDVDWTPPSKIIKLENEDSSDSSDDGSGSDFD